MKNHSTTALALLFVLFHFGLQAQTSEEPGEKCGTDALHLQQLQTDPEYAARFYQKKLAVQEYLYDQIDGYRSDCDDILFIPVAVHFQGTVGLQMPCALDKALDQVRVLNEDFAGTNADITRWQELQAAVWPSIQNKASCVQFCLATLNHPSSSGIPEGDYAVTINQTSGDFNGAWSGYMNIYVRNLGGGTLGYSPLGGDGNGDGITVSPPYFSSVSCDGINIEGGYNLGRTTTHEVGHYFLLDHPFGSCTVDNDGIADTPMTDNATMGCPYVPGNPGANSFVTCTAPVLWPSYMDYCDDACLFMFSAGQVDVMDAYVNTSLQNLLNSAATRCEEPLCVGFRLNAEKQDETCAGFDGSIIVQMENGTAPFIFSLDGGANFQDNGNFSNLRQGEYDLVVTDINGCETTRTVSLIREVPPLSVVETSNAFCGDNSGRALVEVDHPDVFQFSISGQPGWRDTSLFTGLFPGNYTVSVRNDTECTNSISLTIGDDTDLRLNTRRVTPVNCPLLDNGVIWADLSNGVPPYTFTLDQEIVRPTGRFENLSQGTYTLEVEDARGCRQSQTYTIGVSFLEIDQECPCDVFVPNAFTPNADGRNDLLDVVPACPISDFQMQIFDRWGGLVFESFDYNERWNGGQGGKYYAQNEIYFYRISFRWGEALNESLEVQVKTGYVMLLR